VSLAWIILLGLGALAVGLGLGYLLRARQEEQRSAQRERELQSALEAERDRLETYQQRVSKHMDQTAHLFRDLTQQHATLYQHLAQGARELSPQPERLGGHAFGRALSEFAFESSEPAPRAALPQAPRGAETDDAEPAPASPPEPAELQVTGEADDLQEPAEPAARTAEASTEARAGLLEQERSTAEGANLGPDDLGIPDESTECHATPARLSSEADAERSAADSRSPTDGPTPEPSAPPPTESAKDTPAPSGGASSSPRVRAAPSPSRGTRASSSHSSSV